MTLHTHRKHTKLIRPEYGSFGRNEWAIVGTNCEAIKNLADKLLSHFSVNYNCVYIDASHNDALQTLPGRLNAGAYIEFTTHEGYSHINDSRIPTDFHNHSMFSDADLILVNGNHHQANAQVVVIDPKKEESLKKRLSQLNNIELILLSGDQTEAFDFIKNVIGTTSDLPVFHIDDTEKIISFFSRKLINAVPKLNGLVLAGGKSMRMGYDKTMIKWHGKEQRYYIADMLKSVCDGVYISCREEQKLEIDTEYNTLTDTFTDLGPFGAILSAFRHQPNTAWLVVASDLPLIDKQTFETLKQNRSSKAIATAFESPVDKMPEPLIAIWEPKSYPLLLSFLGQGYSCPRKVLMNNPVKIISVGSSDILKNINTPLEADEVNEILTNKTKTR